MKNERASGKQMAWWLGIAAAAPAAGIYGGSALLWLLGAALGGGLSALVLWLTPEDLGENRALRGIQWVWSAILLSQFLPNSGTSWGSETGPAVPLITLALAALACAGGGRRMARIGTVLGILSAGVYALLFLLGAGKLRWEWVLENNWDPRPLALIPALLPCIGALLGGDRGKKGWNWAIPALVALAFSLWINGTLSPAVAGAGADPFYEYSKSISLGGSVKRLEAAVACFSTVGWFSFFGMLLAAAGEAWLCAGAAAALFLAGVRIPQEVLAGGTVLFWVAFPALFGAVKKSKKTKKGVDKGGEK